MAWINTSPPVKTYTLDEFWRLPDPPDRSKLELIAGVLYMTPPPDWSHDKLVARLNELLSAHLRSTSTKGTSYAPAPRSGRARARISSPIYSISAKLEAQLDPEHLTTADLVIEAISPESAIYDRNTKADT
jgi:Uma2 family endonuclease